MRGRHISLLLNSKLYCLAGRPGHLHGHFLIVRVDGEGAVVFDRAGCEGSEIAPGVESQAAHFVPKSLHDFVILTAQDKQLVRVAPDYWAYLKQAEGAPLVQAVFVTQRFQALFTLCHFD